MNKVKILVVEDDPAISFLLEENLRFEGYTVNISSDGAAAFEKVSSWQPDLLILDLMLPGMSGMELCKRLRKAGDNRPILMLTSRSLPMDKVMGLKSGADDYLTKPFELMELIARVEAILRRVGQQSAFEKHRGKNWEVDWKAGILIRKGEKISLSRKEKQLLHYFMSRPEKVLSREQIMQDVWGHQELLSYRTIDTHVTYLRQKLEENPSNPVFLVTVHRIGYQFFPEGKKG